MPHLKTTRMEYLDGLRGLAAMVVIFHHFACAFYPAMIFGGSTAAHSVYDWMMYGTPLNLLINGNFAVCIFFVLGGYVLSYSTFRNPDHNKLVSTVIRRYFRLMIPVLGSVFIAYLLMKLHLFYNTGIAGKTGSTMWLGLYYKFVPNFWEMFFQGTVFSFISGKASSYNNVIWTISIEFLGSIIVFSFLGLFMNFKHRWLIYLVLILMYWKGYFLCFVLGMIAADYQPAVSNYLEKTNISPFLYIVFFLALFFGSVPYFSSDNTMYTAFRIPGFGTSQNAIMYHIVGAFLLVECVLNLKLFQKILCSGPILFLGKLSFSLYLLQVLVIFSLSSYLFSVFNKTLGYHTSFGITFILSMILLFVAAYFYRNYVEKAGIVLSQKVDAKLQ